MGKIDKYNYLYEKCTSPKSADHGKGAIYLFEKYCHCCGEGLSRPPIHEKRVYKRLFRLSFCSPECLGEGKRDKTFMLQVKSSKAVRRPNIYAVEKLAFAGLEIRKVIEKLPPLQKLILIAEHTYRLLSEKLRFLEVQTQQSWGASRYYYHLNKIGD